MRYVFENATLKPRYYVAEGVAYDFNTNRSKFRIVGVYWFPHPSGAGLPAMIEHQGWLYDYPPVRPPALFFG